MPDDLPPPHAKDDPSAAPAVDDAPPPLADITEAPPLTLRRPIENAGERITKIKLVREPFSARARIEYGEPQAIERTPDGKILVRDDPKVLSHHVAYAFGIPYAAVTEMNGRDFQDAIAIMNAFFNACSGERAPRARHRQPVR